MYNLHEHWSQGHKHSLNAAQFIANAATEYPGEVVVLALGPLTNIALTYKVKPDIAGLLVSVSGVLPAASAPSLLHSQHAC